MKRAWRPILRFPWRRRLGGNNETVRGPSPPSKRVRAAARRIICSHPVDQERVLVDVWIERALRHCPDALSVLNERDRRTTHPVSGKSNFLSRRRPESEDDRAIAAHLR